MPLTIADWAKESARVHALRLAVCERGADPVGGRTRLIKELARKHNASDQLMMLDYPRVGARLSPINAFAFQDLDAYVAAWRDVLVKELRRYNAMVCACHGDIRWRRRAEERFARGHPQSDKTHKARALRA
jgi:hypothetical protein